MLWNAACHNGFVTVRGLLKETSSLHAPTFMQNSIVGGTAPGCLSAGW